MSIENPINGYGGYNAIETDKGVLLFSRTDEGITLFHDYMNLFMDNLYNPLCNNAYFNLHYIESTDPFLREKCDIALRFPETLLPLQFPIKEECLTDISVLKNSIDVKINGWEPTLEQIQRITDYVDGADIPVRGDTFDISTLQEIAGGVSYNRVLQSGMMSDFKYEKEFLDLAKKIEDGSPGNEARQLFCDMKRRASDILKRDYPDMRMEQKPCLRKIDDSDIEHLSWESGTNRFNAIEEDKGVLLFSRTEEGKELFRKYLEKYLDNFYNPICDNTFFNIHYLECDNGTLRGQCDLELRFPSLNQTEFPVNNYFFADKEVLKYSAQVTKFSWNPNFEQVNKMLNHFFDGEFLPIRGDTYNISILQELAAGKRDYHYNLAFHGMGGFKYNNDFRELADLSLSYSGHIHQYKVVNAIQDKAKEILKRDFPNIRKMHEPSIMNKKPILQIPPQKKKGLGL